MSAFAIRYPTIESMNSETPIPIRMKRYPDMPSRHARRYTSREPTNAPTSAAREMPGPPTCNRRIEPTANRLAPEETPTKSGEASGFASSFWKSRPETPSASPTDKPVAATGSRRSRTMKSTAGSLRRWSADAITSHGAIT